MESAPSPNSEFVYPGRTGCVLQQYGVRAVITLHRDIAFSGPTASAVGQKLAAFQSRCAAHDVHCHVGVGDVAFGDHIVATYEMTLVGEAQAIDEALNPGVPRSALRRGARPAHPGSPPAAATVRLLN